MSNLAMAIKVEVPDLVAAIVRLATAVNPDPNILTPNEPRPQMPAPAPAPIAPPAPQPQVMTPVPPVAAPVAPAAPVVPVTAPAPAPTPVFLDAIHYHVRSEGQVVKKAVYIAIGRPERRARYVGRRE